MSETGQLPAGTTVYHCPLSTCEWTHAQAPPDPFAPGPVVSGESLDESMARASMAILAEWYAEGERAIEAHVGTHTPLEWVTEIMCLRGEITGLRRVAQAAIEWDALIEAAAPMSYVTEPAGLAGREREAEAALREAVSAIRSLTP